MVGNFILPPTGYGPGSQPVDDGGELEYMSMPQDMRTFTSRVPDVEVDETLMPALNLLQTIAAASMAAAEGAPNGHFDLADLDDKNRALIMETMGEGEVSIRAHGIPATAVQESVFAGVWVVRTGDHVAIEVGAIPDVVEARGFVPRRAAAGLKAHKTPSVVNAPSILVELLDKSAQFVPTTETHTVNLTLLPHTEGDLDWLDVAMGQGSVDILSRGYGNCRVTATGVPHVWRVQFFNSMDTLILDTFEVTTIPEVVVAATEDLTDSGERILEVLEAIR